MSTSFLGFSSSPAISLSSWTSAVTQVVRWQYGNVETLQSTWQSELQSEAVRQHIISLAVVTGHVSADTLSWSSALLHFMFSSWVLGQGCQALMFFSGKPCSVFFSHHCQLDLHKTLDKMYICRFGAEPALNMGRLCLLKLILFASWFHIWSSSILRSFCSSTSGTSLL